MKRNDKHGFSLIELLAVTAIISILAGMIGVAAHNARQRAYATIARTETQQIATAFKSYWISHGQWPDGFSSGTDVELSEDVLKNSGLLGDGANGMVYLELSADRLEVGPTGGGKYFLDPWGHPYLVKLGKVSETTETQKFQGVVRFMNSDKYYYQDY